MEVGCTVIGRTTEISCTAVLGTAELYCVSVTLVFGAMEVCMTYVCRWRFGRAKSGVFFVGGVVKVGCTVIGRTTEISCIPVTLVFGTTKEG